MEHCKQSMDALSSTSTPPSSRRSPEVNESCYSFSTNTNSNNNNNNNNKSMPSPIPWANTVTNSSPLAQTDLHFNDGDEIVQTKHQCHSFKYCDKMTSLSTPITRNLIFNSPFQSRSHSPSSNCNSNGSCNGEQSDNSNHSSSSPCFSQNNNFFAITSSRSYCSSNQSSMYPSPLNSSRSDSHNSQKRKPNPFSTGPIFNPFVSYIDPCRYSKLPLSNVIKAIIIFKRLLKKTRAFCHNNKPKSSSILTRPPPTATADDLTEEPVNIANYVPFA